MGLVDWGSVDKSKGGNNEFLRLKSGGKYQVRLAHKALPVWRIYNQENKRSVVVSNESEAPGDNPISVKHNLKAKERYAIYVIDRADNKIKVMEAPAQVFRFFRDYFESEGIDPGGIEALDFKISVEGTGLQTKYKVIPSKPTTLTEEERAAIKEKLTNHKLGDMKSLKATPESELEAALFGEREERPSRAADTAGDDEPAEKPAAPKGAAKGGSTEDTDW